MILDATWPWSVALSVILWVAALHDIRTLTIPHSYTYAALCLLALFILVALMSGTAPAVVMTSLLGGLLALLVGFAMFSLRIMGAGDVKIFAATAPFFLITELGWVFAAISIAGLVWTLAYVGGRYAAARIRPKGTGGSLADIRRMRVAYGPAIAAGVSIALFAPRVFA